jgi:biopolymer transport protein ExbD
MRLQKEEFEHETELNMTPMIDIVFLLIIFFMVVSEMASSQLEKVKLPRADMAEQKEPVEPFRKIVVNVLRNGTVKIAGMAFKKPELEKRIRIEALAAGTEPNPSNPNLPTSKLMVTIRGDKDVRYEKIQDVFEACQKHGVWKTVIMAVRAKIK